MKLLGKKIAPAIPAELWMLWNRPNESCVGNHWVVAIDGACDVLMAFDNGDDAKREARRQNKIYELNCIAVKVK